jgi:hypothetical protein
MMCDIPLAMCDIPLGISEGYIIITQDYTADKAIGPGEL